MKSFELENGEVVHGDCLEGLKKIEENQVILGFTSPPYLNAINYEDHIKKLEGEKDRWKRKDIAYDEYKEFLKKRFSEVLRVTRPGGHTVVNISPVYWEGERIPLPFHFVGLMEDLGWKFKEDIIWEKPVAKDRRSGVFLQHPYPGYYYPSVVSEYILVFQKEAEDPDKNNIYWFRDEKEKKQNEINLNNFQGEMSKNVWKIRPISPNENIHPAPFPRKLAKRIIKFYSYKGDTVMDIFMGSGQTILGAQDLKREFLGFETQKKYVDYSIDKIKKEASQKTFDEIE